MTVPTYGVCEWGQDTVEAQAPRTGEVRGLDKLPPITIAVTSRLKRLRGKESASARVSEGVSSDFELEYV